MIVMVEGRAVKNDVGEFLVVVLAAFPSLCRRAQNLYRHDSDQQETKKKNHKKIIKSELKEWQAKTTRT